MPGPTNDLSVEERIEKARLTSRINPEVLNMAKSVDQLLHAQHMSNLAQAIVCVQELARDHYALVIALKWVVLLVDLLESDNQDVRLAACNALAAVCMVQEGRDALRTSGGLRPLVMLLAEGSRSPVAAGAAAALMNCSACDTCKEAIADCRGVPQLLALMRDAVGRTHPAGNQSISGRGLGGLGMSASSTVNRGGGGAPRAPAEGDPQDLRSPGECKAAVYAAGALMNMGGVISVQEKLMAAGAVPLFETVLRISAAGDVVATRANFMLSWLAVASGATSTASERRMQQQQQQQQQQLQQQLQLQQQQRRSMTMDSEGGASVVSTPRLELPQPSIDSQQSGGVPHQPSIDSALSSPQLSQEQPQPQPQQQPQQQPQPQHRGASPARGKLAGGPAAGGSRGGAKPMAPSGGGKAVTGRA